MQAPEKPPPQPASRTEYAVLGTANDGWPGEWRWSAADADTARRRAERYQAAETHYRFRAVQRTIHTGPWEDIPNG